MSEAVIGGNVIAPIETVRRCMTALQQAVERDDHLPGIVAMYGPSGVGKSQAAAFAANTFQAYYVEMRSLWTKKALLTSILKEMGLAPAKNMPEMLDQICEELALSRKPLIIDEFDYAVEKNMVNIIRDIYEGSNTAILLIGEEHLSAKILRKSERFHNRMLHWAKAEPATQQDAQKLRNFYCRDVQVEDCLLEHIRQFNGGCVRRICVNLDRVIKDSQRTGRTSVTRADWGDKELYSGNPQRGGRAIV